MILAVTGGTGFVGSHVLDRALAAGHTIRALTRRQQAAREGVIWIRGALDQPGALDALITGCDAVIHVAGVVDAPDRAGFAAGNVDGTRTMLDAARKGRPARFVHVSSLAAREPALSDYGWSKAEAERLVAASDRGWTIVRPPAVYGPGDTEMRDVFRLAKLGLALLPPPGRASIIAVEDLAALLVTLAEHEAPGAIYEPDDGTGGWAHASLARAIGAAVGRRVLPLPLPAALLLLAARIDRRVRGAAAKLTLDRARYLAHPDWTADPAKQPPRDLWKPTTDTLTGLAATARWYRERGLL